MDQPTIEAFVVPGGNFATMTATGAWEQEFGKPVVTTNNASFWAMLRAFDALGGGVLEFGQLLARLPIG